MRATPDSQPPRGRSRHDGFNSRVDGFRPPGAPLGGPGARDNWLYRANRQRPKGTEEERSLQLSWHAKEAHNGPVPVDDTAGPEQLLDAYFEAASGAISRNTERALRADIHVFTAWCSRRLTRPFPASPKTLVAFIDEMTASRTPATVRRYLSSITTMQKRLGETSPLENASVRFALQRMHRRRGRRQTQVHGLTCRSGTACSKQPETG